MPTRVSDRLDNTVDRAFQTILMFLEGRPVTVRDVQERLGVVRSCAYRYIQAACINMPIYAVNEDDRGYHEHFQYQLMEE